MTTPPTPVHVGAGGRRARRAAPLGMGLFVALAGAVALSQYWGYAGDDTFIHLQYARNIASGNGFAFNPGEPSYGSTSPLWTILIAGGGQLAGGRFYLAAKVLSALAYVGAVVAVFVLARRVTPGRVPPLCAAALVAFDPWMLKWGASGMETSLAVALAVSAVTMHLVRRNEGGIPASAFLLGIATLVRPELVGLFLVCTVDRVFFARRPLYESAFGVFLFLVPLLPWALFALSTFGDVVPTTIHAKAGHTSWIDAATRTVKILGSSMVPLTLLGVAGAIAALRRPVPWAARLRWVTDRTAVWGWAFGLPVAYVLTESYVASRYLLLCTPFLAVLVVAALDAIPERHRSRVALATIVASLAGSILVQAQVVYPRTRFVRGVDESLIAIGDWLRSRTDENAVVAVHEVGAVGFFAERRVIDTAGLVTPGVLPYVTSYRVADYLIEARPDYYVSSGDDRIDRQVFESLGSRLNVVFETTVQRGGSSARFAEPMPMAVYAFDWESPPS